MKQLPLIPLPNTRSLFAPQKGKRKSQRPLTTRDPIHLILKSTRADLLRKEKLIQKTWRRLSKSFGIKTYQLVVNRDHMHAIIRLHSRPNYKSFIQALTGALAKAAKIKWLNRPATRIATWGRDFKRLRQYLKLNFLEANSLISYQKERTRGLSRKLLKMIESSA